MVRSVKWLVLGIVVLGVGCAVYQMHELDKKYGEPSVVNRRINTPAPGAVSFHDDVLPILEKRCDVCHSCYDAPCQLKMTCFEGIDRGGSKKIVYDSARLKSEDPTRLSVDADSTEKWRGKSFHTVLNERIQSAEANKENSLIVKLLEQKRAHPLPDVMIMPDVFDLRLNHNYICATIEEYDQYKDKYPLWGMPYALPGLTDEEHKTLVDWTVQGGLAEPEDPVSPEAAAVISDWETFLNGTSLKERLMSRYLYEHLFIGRLHFDP